MGAGHQDLTGEALLDSLFPLPAPWARSFRILASQINDDDYHAQTLLDQLRTGLTQPELPTDVDYVRVMTLHKSKGLTADLVVVVGCIQGLLPSVYEGPSDAERRRNLEEQRRLFYVAITRTTKTLVLSSITSIARKTAYRIRVPVRGGNRTHASTIASQFLSELGPTAPTPIRGRDL